MIKSIDGISVAGGTDLGDGVAVLHLDRHLLDPGAVHTVLLAHLPAVVLDCGQDLVPRAHCGGWHQAGGQKGSLGLPLDQEMGMHRGSITEHTEHCLAQLLIAYLLCEHLCLGAHQVRSGGAGLGGQGLKGVMTGGGRGHSSNSSNSCYCWHHTTMSQIVRVSLGDRVSCGNRLSTFATNKDQYLDLLFLLQIGLRLDENVSEVLSLLLISKDETQASTQNGKIIR